MTRLWRQAKGRAQITDADFEDISALNNVIRNVPKRLGKSFPKITLRVSTRHKPNDFFVMGTLFIASDRLKSIFTECRVNAEYHPVDIVHHGKPYTEQTFYYVHLLDHVDCLDWKKSRYNPDDCRNADNLRLLTIDEKKAAGFPLFKLARVYDWIWLCSDQLAKRVGNEKEISGMELCLPKDFKSNPRDQW